MKVPEISRLYHMSKEHIRTIIHRFNKEGIESSTPGTEAEDHPRLLRRPGKDRGIGTNSPENLGTSFHRLVSEKVEG